MSRKPFEPRNRYFKYTKLTDEQVDLTLRCFAEDLTAIEAAKRVGISVRSMNRLFQMLREQVCHLGMGSYLWSRDDERDAVLASTEFQAYNRERIRRMRGWHSKFIGLNEMETYQRFIRLDQGVEGLLAEIQEALLMVPLGTLRLSPLWNHQDWADAYTRTGNLSGRYNQWKRED